MADTDTSGYRTITRQIEYFGPPEWLETTLASSRIPIQGVKQFPSGAYIKSGVVMWQTEAEMNEMEEKVKTVPFKRPGE